MPPDARLEPALWQYFGVMSLKYAPYTFLRVLDDGSCRFDTHHCLDHEQFSIEPDSEDGVFYFVSKKNGKTIQAEENKTAKTANTNRRSYEKWKVKAHLGSHP